MKRAWFSLVPVAALLITGCDDPGAAECVNASSGVSAKFVADTLLVPQSRMDYALDLNGDQKADNQLGNIIGALTQQGLNTQDGVNSAIMDGNVILLLNASAADLTNDTCASVEAAAGKSMMNPDFSGNGSFMKDTAVGGGTFKGKITNGTFDSNSPVTTSTPATVTIQLPLVAGATPVSLKITGAHLKFTKQGDKLINAQINGAIKKTDVDGEIIPSVAKLLSDRIAADPNGSTNMQILSLFDNGGVDEGCMGGCKNADGTCGVKMDKKIQVCEVATNSIIKNVLAPDVDLFEDAGNTVYKPNKDNTGKDSLSLGLKFTAVKANF
jgi:hypothetical protein